MASAAPHAEMPSASARAPRPSFWAPFRSTDDRHSHTFSLSGKPTVKRIVQQSSNDGDKRPRCFTCSPARTFSELPGHAFVTCKTIVQSLLFCTRVVDRFLYITKVRRITTTFRSSVTRQVRVRGVLRGRVSAARSHVKCHTRHSHGDLRIAKTGTR